MPRYRKRPVVVEAVQFLGSSSQVANIRYWMGGQVYREGMGGVRTSDLTSFTITTLEGEMTVRPGDYVIKGVQGEFYPCKPDIFEQTYELEN